MRPMVQPLIRLLLAAGLLLTTPPALARVVSSSPEGFVSENTALLDVRPARVWGALIRWSKWWDKAHSYSNQKGAMTLDPRAGGQLLERWDNNSVEHAVVLAVVEPSSLRLSGGFGPLQSLPVTAVLEFSLRGEGTGTRLTMTYRVAGTPASNLDALSTAVDSVLSESFARLLNYATSGKP